MNDFSALGERLKDTRIKMGLSLGDVATMTGVSKTMLSKIERSEAIPTIATVCKIANGLKIKFETLSESVNKSYAVKSIDGMAPLKDSNGHLLLYSVFPFSPVNGLEIFYGIVKPGCNSRLRKHQNGHTEYIMVFQGEIDVVVGANTYHIKASSGIDFDSKEDHAYINRGEVDALVCFMLSYN